MEHRVEGIEERGWYGWRGWRKEVEGIEEMVEKGGGNVRKG